MIAFKFYDPDGVEAERGHADSFEEAGRRVATYLSAMADEDMAAAAHIEFTPTTHKRTRTYCIKCDVSADVEFASYAEAIAWIGDNNIWDLLEAKEVEVGMLRLYDDRGNLMEEG